MYSTFVLIDVYRWCFCPLSVFVFSSFSLWRCWTMKRRPTTSWGPSSASAGAELPLETSTSPFEAVCQGRLLLSFVVGVGRFLKKIYLLGPLHTERAAKEQQEIPNLLDTNLSCKFMRCKKPSLSPSNPLPTQRALTSATSWTRQCRPTRWWGTATTPTVTWSPCCVNQRTSSTPPSPLPTRPRHYRAARSVWHLYIFVCELKYWECAFFFYFYVCVP